METIAGGKTPGLCLVEALPAEVVALGISICDTTRDGSRIDGNPEVEILLSGAVQTHCLLVFPVEVSAHRREWLRAGIRLSRHTDLKTRNQTLSQEAANTASLAGTIEARPRRWRNKGALLPRLTRILARAV